MKQPQLGRKIAELRKAKGLTQEELVNVCNLSVRTLQRIESGDVSPRSYTQRIIFTALEYDIHGSSVKVSSIIEKALSAIGSAIGIGVRGLLDLFNLKTDTMKKLSILTLSLILIGLGMNSILSKSNAQSIEEVTRIIESNNANFVRWFNNGDIDSLVSLYREDACLLAVGCGKTAVFAFFASEMNNYVFEELRVESVSLSDTIAVEKGVFKIDHHVAGKLEGMFMSEWRYTDERWLIVNDISSLE